MMLKSLTHGQRSTPALMVFALAAAALSWWWTPAFAADDPAQTIQAGQMAMQLFCFSSVWNRWPKR